MHKDLCLLNLLGCINGHLFSQSLSSYFLSLFNTLLFLVVLQNAFFYVCIVCVCVIRVHVFMYVHIYE